MVHRASKLAISENNASNDAGDNRNVVRLIYNTGVSKVFHVEADGLEVNPFLTAFTPDL